MQLECHVIIQLTTAADETFYLIFYHPLLWLASTVIYRINNVSTHTYTQAIINHLRQYSHASTYGSAMSAPVAQQVISSMKIIMGEDGTKEGTCVCVPPSVCT